MGRISSWVFVVVIFVVLAGLAASCGGEEPSGESGTESRGADSAGSANSQGERTTEKEREPEKKEPTREAAEARDEAEKEEPDDAQYETQYAEAPADPTMYLTIPKLGIADAVVVGGEAGLEIGAMHLPGTGYPWQPGSNTYIAGHRVGFPGTGSDRIFYDLPAMAVGDEVILEDTLGQTYTYAVSEVFAVTPTDLWVTAPTGSDMVSLQVCTETPDDWWTIGPSLMSSGPESGRLIVRAIRV